MIHVVTGQTATGKTAYALDLAAKLNGELINADSRQIYKGLDIITGKDLDLTTNKFHLEERINAFDIGYYSIPKKELREETKIWLYDILDPSSAFSAFDFDILVRNVIGNIKKRRKTPIIVGGTYFYIQQLLYGTSNNFVKPNPELRNVLSQKSVDELIQILKDKNPVLLNLLNNSELHNPQRLIRKIEIETDKQATSQKNSIQLIQDSFKITGFVFENKDELKKSITKRVEKRLEYGAVDEVKKLLKNGYTKNDPGIKTIGYVQIIDYCEDKLSWEEMKDSWITKEVQYAKRQHTLMKKDQHIHWKKV